MPNQRLSLPYKWELIKSEQGGFSNMLSWQGKKENTVD